jgi:FPC/CPF motif-containing protein YcgG
MSTPDIFHDELFGPPTFLPQTVPSEATASLDSALLTQQQLFSPAPALPAWLPIVYAEFRRHVLDPRYPCYFAVAGEQKGTLRYSFVNDVATGIDTAALRELIRLSHENPEKRQALVVFVRPEEQLRSHDWYVRCGWDLLQKLHDADNTPWPADIPLSPAHADWEFCFGGEPLFVFGAFPSHYRRRSRNLGPSAVLLFQPRSVFRGIEGGTAGGVQARRVIRRRLAAWDLAPLHQSMGDYGDPSNFEASQYFIPDGPETSGPCPLVIRGAAPAASALPANQPTVALIPGRSVGLEPAIHELLQIHNCVEVQVDRPGQLHPLHTHPVHETLQIISGELHFHVNGEDFTASSGTSIQLPAHTPHSSTAGPTGCLYLIAQQH